MTIEVTENEDKSLTISWDKNDPIESQLNHWTEQDFIDTIVNRANQTLEENRVLKNPDEFVLENVKMMHLERMNSNALWVGCYTQDNKIYHLNIVVKDNQLNYFWSDETCDK